MYHKISSLPNTHYLVISGRDIRREDLLNQHNSDKIYTEFPIALQGLNLDHLCNEEVIDYYKFDDDLTDEQIREICFEKLNHLFLKIHYFFVRSNHCPSGHPCLCLVKNEHQSPSAITEEVIDAYLDKIKNIYDIIAPGSSYLDLTFEGFWLEFPVYYLKTY